MLNKLARTRFAPVAAMLVLLAGLPGQGWAESPALNKKQIKELISTAKTAADHQRLADHYTQEAAKLTAEAKDHAEMAAMYAKSPTVHETKHPNSGQTAGHCKTMADRYTAMAKDAQELAKLHAGMAKAAK